MSKQKALRAKKEKSPDAPRESPLQRELAMPKYGYQSPASGSFVAHYDEVEERKKRPAPVPALHNFTFAL
jgi:hypothetical protein